MNAENAIQSTYDRFFGGERNLGPVERAVSTGLGLIMAAGGVRRADVPGAIMGLAGAALVARGMSGHCPMKAMMQGDGHHGLSDMSGGDGQRDGQHLRNEAYGHDDTRLRTYS
ncbi:YgaP family membrane protein [Azospirillum rugosum]|uniref:Inner membrane protein YgaP-like transmembrane domain-containing protein n=1 Tax=Azospirillum rugosum TaxID=416170 RepID=A0ABS4SEB9_9PROT|nr:DUF2892 domain-containing protein [Azospirillum rugosum]MBP2290931.1 hypothetical protein [Azospirillum rugosum]MDQ0525005.1 hypothetical protein [Azospirillum rugosum]